MTEPPDERARRFEALFTDHYRAVGALLRRLGAGESTPDLAEETFLAAWRRIDDAPAEARIWLFGIARGLLANERRAARRAGALRERLGGMVRAEAQEPAEYLVRGPAWDAFLALGEREREAVALVAWQGLSPAEAAQVAGCSRAAFRVRLHRARTRLQTALAPAGAPPTEAVPGGDAT